MDIIPYMSFLIFFVIIFFLTNSLIYDWISRQCCSEFGSSIVLALIVGSTAFIWNALIVKYIKLNVEICSKKNLDLK